MSFVCWRNLALLQSFGCVSASERSGQAVRLCSDKNRNAKCVLAEKFKKCESRAFGFQSFSLSVQLFHKSVISVSLLFNVLSLFFSARHTMIGDIITF